MDNQNEASTMETKQTLAIIGSYTRKDNHGIHVYQYGAKFGELSLLSSVKDISNPTFITTNKAGDKVYALSEFKKDDERRGAVKSYSLDKSTGNLEFLNETETSGSSLCHISINSDETMLLVVSYGGGSVSSIALKSDGTLDQETSFIKHEGSGGSHSRQDQPHTHSAFFSPDDRFALVCDLGTNLVYSYTINQDANSLDNDKVTTVTMPESAGPRHLAFHPNGSIVYVINEINSTVSVCDYDSSTGKLALKQTITTLPDDFKEGPNKTAEIVVSKCGRFVYGSNRGHDSIVVFSIKEGSGELTSIQCISCGGDHPRNFNIDASGNILFALNKNSDNAVSFYIDSTTGLLKPTGHSYEVPDPVCIKFV